MALGENHDIVMTGDDSVYSDDYPMGRRGYSEVVTSTVSASACSLPSKWKVHLFIAAAFHKKSKFTWNKRTRMYVS